VGGTKRGGPVQTGEWNYKKRKKPYISKVIEAGGGKPGTRDKT